MWCLHKWANWGEPKEAIVSRFGSSNEIGVIQTRTCAKCGKVQYRSLKGLISFRNR